MLNAQAEHQQAVHAQQNTLWLEHYGRKQEKSFYAMKKSSYIQARKQWSYFPMPSKLPI